MSQWKASAIGKRSKDVREFLESKYEEGQSQDESIHLAVESLLQVVESAKNMEVMLVKPGNVYENVKGEVLNEIASAIIAEKEAKEEEKKGGR